MSQIGVVILAAGEAVRLGKPKQLIEFKGEPLLRRAAKSVIAAGLTPIVVLGAILEPCHEVLRDLDATIVQNDRWRDGIASSIVAGLSAAEQRGVDAVLLMVCDQPRISAESLRRVIEAYPGHGIAAARYGGTFGTPAIFSSKFFSALRTLSGDRGAKAIIQSSSSEVVMVDLPEAAFDVDSAADLDEMNRL
jgi:molybdenum cofactor cytidylyltransferase